MLDVCRHFMPVPEIRRLLAAASRCGVNRMHWHLTDDQGWRLEILKYPRLTEVGAFRGATHFGGVSETENNCGFYTQQEVRDLVAYARTLGIDIIPEIEIPGHAAAMLAAGLLRLPADPMYYGLAASALALLPFTQKKRQ